MVHIYVSFTKLLLPTPLPPTPTYLTYFVNEVIRVEI